MDLSMSKTTRSPTHWKYWLFEC